MNRIQQHIDYLLRRHKCVVVPGLGAFIAHRQSAYYDIQDGVMYPPCVVVTFNSSLVHDDGLIANSIARKESVSYETASARMALEIESMKHQLEADGELSMGALGRLVAQKDSAPFFEPAPRWTGSASGYFTPLEIRPMLDRMREEAAIARIEAHKRRSRLRLRSLKIAKVAAAVVGVCVVASAVLFSPVFRSRYDVRASLAEYPAQVSASLQTSVVPIGASDAPTLNIMSPHEDAAAPMLTESAPTITSTAVRDKVLEVTHPQSASTVRMNDSDSYCLIVASLTSQELAEQFIRDAGDNSLKILHSNGKYRVYAATGSTSVEALAQKSNGSLASKYSDAWVCRR